MQSSPKSLKSWWLASGLALAACNLMNPSGAGDVGDTVDARLSEGEGYFRQQDYPKAMEAFSKAIEADSANSLAYYGYAKSAMRNYEVNASSILGELDKAQTGGGIPFIGADDKVVTKYLQGTSKTRKALGMLTERDTLTRWYQYSLNPNSKAALKDPARDIRIAFIKDYLDKAEKGFPGYRGKARFPLSDMKMGYDKLIADFSAVEMIYAVTQLRDLDRNEIIDSNDNLLKKLKFDVSGGFKVDNLKDIAADLATPANRDNVNNLIQNVASGLSSAGNVLSLLGPAISQAGGDTTGKGGSLTGDVSKNMDSVISSIGDAVTFYQFGDSRDNDGDGCVDEEILDGKDNDGDGFTDEDARVIPTDLVDNDHNGKQGVFDPDEGLDSDGALRFTAAAGFVKGPSYKDKNVKVWIQKDSLDIRTIPSKVVLDSAKKAIGGCWNNY